MKLYNKKKKRRLALAIIIGLFFSAYLLYEQTGKIGQIELIALGFSFVLAILISSIIIKIGNK